MKLNHLFPYIAHHTGSLKERSYKYDFLRALLSVRKELKLDNDVVVLIGNYDRLVQELSKAFPTDDVRRILNDFLWYPEVKDALQSYVGEEESDDEAADPTYQASSEDESEEEDEEESDEDDQEDGEEKTFNVDVNVRCCGAADNEKAVFDMYDSGSDAVRDFLMFTLITLNTFFSAAVFIKLYG